MGEAARRLFFTRPFEPVRVPGNDYVFGVSVEGDKSADLGSY